MSFIIKELENEEDWLFFKQLDFESYALTVKDADELTEEELWEKYEEFDKSDGINPRDSNHAIFIIWSKEDVRAGLIWLCNREPFWRFEKQHVWIFNLHIISDFRQMGLARLLMNKAEEWCLEQGIDRIALHALEDNTAVRNLYESLNYKLVDTHFESCFYEKMLTEK